MVKEFELESSLGFVFSPDFKYVLLIKNKLNVKGVGILDGFLFPTTDPVLFSIKFFEKTKIQIEPMLWRTALTLPTIDKKHKLNILFATSDLSKHMDYSDDYTCHPSYGYSIPSICHPACKWLIPLIIDPSIHHSQFNQIILQA